MSKPHEIITRQPDEEGQLSRSVYACEHCSKQASTKEALEAMACLNDATGQLPFWSDDFDMDLVALFPQLPNMLQDTAQETMWTFGGETFTRLNHPAVWNWSTGPIAMFWKNKPAIQPDEKGWFRLVNGMVTDRPLIEATWLEVLRDAWSHCFLVMCDGEGLWNTADDELRRIFDAIMWHIRGVTPRDNEIKTLKGLALTSVMQANERFKLLLKRQAARNN